MTCLSIHEREVFYSENHEVLRTHQDMVELLSEGNIFTTVRAFVLLRQLTKARIILTLRSDYFRDVFLDQQKKDDLNKKYCPKILCLLAYCSPDYLDLEHHFSRSFIHFVKSRYPEIRIIVSYHNFDSCSIDLEKVYTYLQHLSADFYKLASGIKSFEDIFYWILFLKKNKNIIPIIMYKKWSWTRILFPLLGFCWSYCSLKGNESLGQFSLTSLNEEYRLKRTFFSVPNVYALIGALENIKRSPGHIFHNLCFAMSAENSLYLKIPVEKHEWSLFIAFSKKCDFFKGFSITSPFKEDMLSYLDESSEEVLAIGAVNTVVALENKWKGYNTDGQGACEYLEESYGSISRKSVAILGSGGAALALLYEAEKKGAKVFVFCRNEKKRKEIKKHFSVIDVLDLKVFSADKFDVIINTLPPAVNTDFVIPRSSHIVFDISVSGFTVTNLLRRAETNSSLLAYGYGMFVYQAMRQQRLWYSDEINAIPQVF